MKMLIVWMAALALLAIGGHVYAEEGSHKTTGKQDTLMPESNRADRGGPQQVVENKNATYELVGKAPRSNTLSRRKPEISSGKVPPPEIGLDMDDDGNAVVTRRRQTQPAPVPAPAPVPPKPPVRRTDPGFDPDKDPLA